MESRNRPYPPVIMVKGSLDLVHGITKAILSTQKVRAPDVWTHLDIEPTSFSSPSSNSTLGLIPLISASSSAIVVGLKILMV